MKKTLYLLIMTLLVTTAAHSQITGTKTIPGDYPSIASAIAALNASGTGGSGVTFNIAAGYTETFSTPASGTITTLSGSAASPIAFVKSGTGANPLITAATGTGSQDAIITIGGSDYITINGIDLSENAANNEPVSYTEYGIAILKNSATDGSQNISISNCTINLNKLHSASTGIYSNNHTAGSTVQLTVTNLAGTNSNLNINSNTISNCYRGIYLAGYNDATVPYTYYDQNNKIGYDGGNTITNVGGGSVVAYGIFTTNQNNLDVSNNILTSSMGGTQPHYGIYLSTAKNANYTLSGNYVSMQYTGNNAFYPIYSEMGGSGTNNTVQVYNNTVTGCTYTTATTSSAYFMYLNYLGYSSFVYGNAVTNNVYGSASSVATGRIYYLYCTKTSSTPGDIRVYDNTVTGNSRIQSVLGAGNTNFISVTGSGSSLRLYNNLVNNNILASTGYAYGLYCGFDNGSREIYNNTITNLTTANGTTQGIGMISYSSSAGLTTINNNIIQNISSGPSAQYATFDGINNSSYGTTLIYNNFISNLYNTNATGSATSNNVLNGIALANGISNVYNNTIFLNSTSNGAHYGTSGVYAMASTKLDLRNNNIINLSVPTGNGVSTALRFSSSVLSNYLSTSNYNNFYCGTPSPVNVIFFDGSSGDPTLSVFKQRVSPRELQSISELPPFVNTTTIPYDLHLLNNVATQLESGGSAINAILNDYDDQPRFPHEGYPVNGSYPAGAPDIGADEIGGIPNDITAPSITYTPLQNTNVGTARTITADISDGGGVATSGNGLPMLYWKENNGAWQSVQGSYISGNTYSFVFGQNATPGSTIYYYFVAQDMRAVPNVTAMPWQGASGYTANPPACSVPPTTPASYQVLMGISGTFHVGVGKQYTTITQAITDINTKWINGPITLLLDDATYDSETWPIVFDHNAGSSASSLITIKPNTGVNTVLTANSTAGLFNLSGIDYLVIDGSNNGSASKNLTIRNTSTSSGSYGITISNNNPSSFITIKNCIVQCTPVHSSIISIVAIKIAGASHSNLTITGNTIIGAFHGISIIGTSNGIIQNILINNNMIGSYMDSEAITQVGVYLSYTNNTVVNNNEIMGPYSGSMNVGQTGVYMGGYATSTKVTNNKIHDFYHSTDSGWGASGIWYSSDASSVTEISNNVIYDIKALGINPGAGQNITYGIFVRSGGNVKINHNTISLTGPFMSSYWEASSACLGFYYQATGGGFEVRNNIFRNSMVNNGAPTAYGRAYGIITAGTAAMFSIIDNNDYFIDGYNGSVAQVYVNGMGIITNYTTLAEWQAYTQQEANSVTINPEFTSTTNFLPTSLLLNNEGAYISSIPTDITGKMRTNPSDIGAYEFGIDPFVYTLSSNSVTYNSAIVTGSANAAGSNVTAWFDYGLTNNYGTTVAATPANVTGSSSTGLTASLSDLQFATTYHYRARTISGTGLISYGKDSTFTTMPAPPTVITTDATNVTSSDATLNGLVTANAGLSAVTIQYGLTTAYGSVITATPSTVNGLNATAVSAYISGLTPYTTYHFRVVASNISGTIYGNDMSFTTLPVPASVVTLAATNIIGDLATLNGTVNANYAPSTVTFEWGLTTSYGSTVNASPNLVSGSVTTPVTAVLSGLTTASVYHFRCVATGPGGTVYGLDQQFISDCPAPAMPGSITGQQSVCRNDQGIAYSIDPIANTTGYNWILPEGATIASGANTNSITVNFSLTAVSGTISVAGTNDCGTGALTSMPVTVNILPVPTINGPAEICYNSVAQYSSEISMTNYSWTVTGGTITSGQGTNAITVQWNTAGTQSVSVNYENANGCSAVSPTTYAVLVNELPIPTISGETDVCEWGAYLDYTTEAGMTNYIWDIAPNSGTISITGTNTVTVFWTTSGNQWISVSYTDPNSCNPQSSTVLNVQVSPLPGAAGTINGETIVCAGTSGVEYSINAVTNAVSYDWTLPAGATITSGEGTNSITIDFSINAISGEISVNAVNDCGAGASSALAITVNPKPATPVISLDFDILTSSSPEGNQWYLNGSEITGATSQTYQILENGTYSVVVTLNGCSSDISNSIEFLSTNANNLGSPSNSGMLNVYPNPNMGEFYITVSAPEAATYTISVYNSVGASVYSEGNVYIDNQSIGGYKQSISLNNARPGLYTVVLQSELYRFVKKIMVK